MRRHAAGARTRRGVRATGVIVKRTLGGELACAASWPLLPPRNATQPAGVGGAARRAPRTRGVQGRANVEDRRGSDLVTPNSCARGRRQLARMSYSARPAGPGRVPGSAGGALTASLARPRHFAGTLGKSSKQGDPDTLTRANAVVEPPLTSSAAAEYSASSARRSTSERIRLAQSPRCRLSFSP